MQRVELLGSWLEMGFGSLIIMTLLGLGIKPSKEKDAITNDDEIALNKARTRELTIMKLNQ